MAELIELIAMLEASYSEEGCKCFDHSSDELGLVVMENADAVLAALKAAEAGDRLADTLGELLENLVIHVTMGWETEGLQKPIAQALADWRKAKGEV